MSQIPTSSVSTAKHTSRSRRKTLSHADLKDFLCDLQEDEVEVKMVVVHEENSNSGSSSSSSVSVVDTDLLCHQPPIEMTDEQRIRDMYKLLKGNHQPRYPQDDAYITACQLAREILAHSKYSIFPTRALYPERFRYRPESIESKKELLGSLTPMIGDAEKQRQYDTKESEAFTRCRVNRSKSNRLSCFEYTDLDTGFIITPEEYEKRYMTHLAVIRGQQDAMKLEILHKKQQQQEQQQQTPLLPLQPQHSSSSSGGPLTDTHNTIFLTNHGNQIDVLEKQTIKIVSDSQQSRNVGHENVNMMNDVKMVVTTSTNASTTTVTATSPLVVHIVDPQPESLLPLPQEEVKDALSGTLCPLTMDANDLSTYGDDSVVMTEDDNAFTVGPKRRQRASILLTSFDSPLGSPMNKTQPLSSSSSLGVISVLRIVSVEGESHTHATTTTEATLQPTITTELNTVDDDDVIPMSLSPMAENTLLARLHVSSTRRETLSPASVRTMMFDGIDQEPQSTVVTVDDEAELLVITCSTDRNATDRLVEGSCEIGRGQERVVGFGTAVDLSGVDVKGTEDMDLLSNAISTGRNEIPSPGMKIVTITHEASKRVEEGRVESTDGDAEEWIMDEDEGGFDDALLLRKRAWKTEFRSLSTLPESVDGSISTMMVPTMATASGQGLAGSLATVTPELTDDQVMSSEEQKQAMIFGSELDALLASSNDSESSRDESPRDNSPRDETPRDDAAGTSTIKHSQQPPKHQSRSQETGEKKDIQEETKTDHRPSEQPTDRLDTHPNADMVGIEVEGSNVYMMVTGEGEDSGINQPITYLPSNSADTTALPTIPTSKGSTHVNPFSSIQQPAMAENSVKPGFSQRFAAFRQGLLTHTAGVLGAPVVYPPVANASGGSGFVAIDNGANGSSITTTNGTSGINIPTSVVLEEGGGSNQGGGDSATKRKEGGICESDSATKKSKLTGSTHCSSPINSSCGVMTSLSTNFSDVFNGESMCGRGMEGLPLPPTTYDTMSLQPSEEEEENCMMIDPVDGPVVTDTTSYVGSSRGDVNGSNVATAYGGRLPTTTSSLSLSSLAMTDMEEVERRASARLVVRQQVAYWKYRWEVCSQYAAAQALALVHGRPITQSINNHSSESSETETTTETNVRTVTPEFLLQSHDTSLVIESSMVCSDDHLMCVDANRVDPDCADNDDTVGKDMNHCSVDMDKTSQIGMMTMSGDDQDEDGMNASIGGCHETKHGRH